MLFGNSKKKLLNHRLDEYQGEGSGFSLSSIKSLRIQINKYRPWKGSSYMDLPDWIKNKKAVINVQNRNDNKCFLWSVISALHPAENHVDRVSNYRRFEKEFDLTGLTFPV